MPKISVVMGVFNAAEHLQESIQSVLNQLYHDFELIIINDGSVDETEKIVFKFKDPRIIWKSIAHSGLTKTLKCGLKFSRGVYVARMDADDIAFPGRFLKQVDFLEKNPEVGIVGTAYEVLTETGDKKKPRVPLLVSDLEIRNALPKFNPLFHGSAMIRRDAIEQVGGYDECFKLAQDYDLWFRISRDYQLANLNEVLMLRREGKNTVEKEASQNWYGLRVRLKAICERNSCVWNLVYLIRPFMVAILPVRLKLLIRNFMAHDE